MRKAESRGFVLSLIVSKTDVGAVMAVVVKSKVLAIECCDPLGCQALPPQQSVGLQGHPSPRTSVIDWRGAVVVGRTKLWHLARIAMMLHVTYRLQNRFSASLMVLYFPVSVYRRRNGAQLLHGPCSASSPRKQSVSN